MKVFSLLAAIFFSFSFISTAKAQDAFGLLVNNEGRIIGQAAVFKAGDGILLRLKAEHLDPSGHGMHFHQKADCRDYAEFKLAGPHIMIKGEGEGFFDKKGPHAGNLPNIFPGDDGEIYIEIYSNLVTLDQGINALLDRDGSALILHEKLDDYKSMTAAGARVACAQIKPMGSGGLASPKRKP
jgi:Cu-Zn family superoxide dismutase